MSNGHTLAVNGSKMYYEVHGKGSPLLILHGFTGSGADLIPLFSELAEDHQLIIPDLRGHGRSTNSLDKFEFKQVAEDLFSLLDHLNIDHYRAVGMSGGGCALLHMATQQPERIKSMALVSATPYFPIATREIMRQYSANEKTEEMWNAMRRIHLQGDEQIEKLFQYGAAFCDSYDDMNFTPSLLSTIKAKTFIVQGDRDLFYPVELSVEMHRSIPNSYLWIVPNKGHVPIFEETFPDFIKLLREMT